MDGFRQYLISISAAAIVCGIVKCLSDEKSTSGAIVRLVAGLVMAVTVISPLVTLHPGGLPDLPDHLLASAQAAAETGEEMSRTQEKVIIKDALEAYILDKASSYGADLSAEFYWSAEDPLFPESVILHGTVSPYAKIQLQQIIARDLGIAKENQTWIG